MAPLGAADGPTIYDIGSSVIALLGMLLAAYGLRRQVKREKRTLKVTCRCSFPLGPISAVAPTRMVTVEVINHGHRPAQIDSVGFELADKRTPLVGRSKRSSPSQRTMTRRSMAQAACYPPRYPEAPALHRRPPPGTQKPRRSAVLDQALCRIRTGDPFLTMEVLYQLS
jgi:hypothetical protein